MKKLILRLFHVYIVQQKKAWGFFLLFFLFGILVLFVQRNLLVIKIVRPTLQDARIVAYSKKQITPRKKIKFYYWNDELLQTNEQELLWGENKPDNIKLLIGRWFSFLYEERIIDKQIGVESVALTEFEQDAYLSFDQIFCDRDWSIYKKWQLMDGLCKTLDSADLGLQTVFLLVGNQPLEDDHLDFSQPWPVRSFAYGDLQ